MKYIAIIDHDFIDKEFSTVCIRDKDGNLHDIDAKPLITHMIVLDEGEVVPLEENNIQALINLEMLKRNIDTIREFKKSLRGTENETDN